VEKAAAKFEEEPSRRVVFDVPESLHRNLKKRCLDRKCLLRDYMLELLAREGIVAGDAKAEGTRGR
jgi:hypothetical protein